MCGKLDLEISAESFTIEVPRRAFKRLSFNLAHMSTELATVSTPAMTNSTKTVKDVEIADPVKPIAPITTEDVGLCGGPPKQDFILESLCNYYNVHTNAKMIVDIMQGNSPISLRLIDWFVTNYAKKTNVSYVLNGRYFMVHADYKLQLKAYSKKQLDPFCRRDRIPGGFLFKTIDTRVETTVGQLNIFRWAYNCDVLGYVLEHRADIEEDIAFSNVKSVYKKDDALTVAATDTLVGNVSVGNVPVVNVEGATDGVVAVTPTLPRSDNKAGHTRKKRQELSQAANKTITRHDVSVVISFN